MLLDGAFRALLLLQLLLLVVISGASAVIVPPPTNLSVSCNNLNVTASWKYSKQQPPTIFRVHIGCAAESSVIETTDHQYDLTSFIWSSESRYMDNFCVTVTAEQGSNQSEPVQSETLSFNTLKTTDIQCEVKFPPVDLKWTNSGATVSFRNPFLFYNLTADDPSAACFELKASTNAPNGSSKTFSDKCTAKEKICKLDITFVGDVKKCVRLEGWLFDSLGVGNILFRKDELTCVEEPAEEDHLIALLAVMLSIAAVVVGSITACVCATKAWTMKTNGDLPPSLCPDPREQDPRYNNVSDPDMVVVTATGKHRNEDKSPEFLQDGGFCSDLEGGFSASSKQELEAVPLMGYRTDDNSADSSVRTECVSLRSDEAVEEEEVEDEEVEDEEEFVQNYDRPHNLQMDNVQVDIGDGEMVTAYLGR